MTNKKKIYSLSQIIEMLPEDKHHMAGGMIDDALFMEAQLKKLRAQIEKEGSSENYQYGSKPTAATSTYLQMQKQYGAIIRYLTDLLPSSATPASDGFMDFITK